MYVSMPYCPYAGAGDVIWKSESSSHVIADAHIYDRHIPLVQELITREQHPAPKFWLNPEIKDFYAFTEDDIRLDDYVTGPQIKNIPIAV